MNVLKDTEGIDTEVPYKDNLLHNRNSTIPIQFSHVTLPASRDRFKGTTLSKKLSHTELWMSRDVFIISSQIHAGKHSLLTGI